MDAMLGVFWGHVKGENMSDGKNTLINAGLVRKILKYAQEEAGISPNDAYMFFHYHTIVCPGSGEDAGLQRAQPRPL